MITNRLKDSRSARALNVLRVAPKSRVLFTVQSDEAVFIDTHWIKRQLWCCGEDCPACGSVVCRTRVYFAALVDVGPASKAVLIETVPGAFLRLQERLVFEKMAFGPGLRLSVTRTAKNTAFRFDIEGTGGSLDSSLSTAGTALSAAAVLAGMPLPNRAESFERYEERVAPFARTKLLEAMA